jgi:hypothetical protein
MNKNISINIITAPKRSVPKERAIMIRAKLKIAMRTITVTSSIIFPLLQFAEGG